MAHQKEIDKSWDLLGTSTGLSGNKRSTWVINQMMSQINPSVVHPAQQSQASSEYLASRKQLTNQLAWAQNYQVLVDQFGLAVLALILTDNDVPFNSSMLVIYQFKT